jgi:hypothetical protein
MTLNIQLSPDEERALRKKAEEAGVDLNTFAHRILRSKANRPSLDQVLAPVRARFKKSGMTDDKAAEKYEAEKHAGRAKRRGKPFDE